MSTLTIMRGDVRTVIETVQPVDAYGNQVLGAGGVTNWKFWLTAKHDYGDPDSAAVFQKLPAAWSITTVGNATTPAVVFCNLAPTDTLGLPGYQVSLVFDVQAEDPNGNPYTIDSGILTVTPDVTNVY